MASRISSVLQQLWPFSLLRTDDLKVSSKLVRSLSIPEETKEFVFAIPEPKSGSILYILAVQNLSEKSVSDAVHLIKEIKPNAVVAQITPSTLPEIQAEDETSGNQTNSMPTSSFGVLRKCFNDKINRTQYENLAGKLLLREIFGTEFYGHVLASRQAAKDVHAAFLLLESPQETSSIMMHNADSEKVNQNVMPLTEEKHLFPRTASIVSSSLNRLCLSDPIESEMLKSAIQLLSVSLTRPSKNCPEFKPEDIQVESNFEAPPFARVVYALLLDLHDIFVSLASIEKSLLCAQKMLSDVSKGVPVDAGLLSEVRNFRIAIEGLRIALNNAARCPMNKLINGKSIEFTILPSEEKCSALFTQVLRSQCMRFSSVVAVVDANSLSTIRKHWNTVIPPEVTVLANEGFVRYYNDCDGDNNTVLEGIHKGRLLADAPVVAVGAGATVCLGVSSLSKALPASTFLKLVTYKIPAILKFSFASIQRTAALGLAKILGSSKILAPGVASKASSLKATASAEKIRSVTHTVISYAERTSLLAMRVSFYEIMRKRHLRPIRYAPLATFCCSMAGGAGLWFYGDGIECVAESVPSAPTIASWGRGLQSLCQASLQAEQHSQTRIQEALHSLMCNLKKEINKLGAAEEW